MPPPKAPAAPKEKPSSADSTKSIEGKTPGDQADVAEETEVEAVAESVTATEPEGGDTFEENTGEQPEVAEESDSVSPEAIEEFSGEANDKTTQFVPGDSAPSGIWLM